MKYPKLWEAAKPIVYSRPGADHLSVDVWVQRPGTSDHNRNIRTTLAISEARELLDQLAYHIRKLESQS